MQVWSPSRGIPFIILSDNFIIMNSFKDFAIRLAESSGEFLLQSFKKDETLISARGLSKEITTEYDIENDRFIIKKISETFPEHSILTEESGFIDRNSKYTWIVDSLDGSSNFALGNPFFSISIALMKDKKLTIGVIYAPYLRELYTAEASMGAFLNGKRINVSLVDSLDSSYLLTCEGGEKSNAKIARINALLHPGVKDLRKLGSAAIEGAWVASGRAEAYITTGIYPWDIAAAVLIVREAGGKVSNFEGREWKPEKSNIIASNGKIHEKLIELLIPQGFGRI